MFIQTEVTPNPNSLKFLPGKKVSNSGPYEITSKSETQNVLVRNFIRATIRHFFSRKKLKRMRIWCYFCLNEHELYIVNI